MKLLIDQNVSPWLCENLSDLFPDSVHVRDAGLRDAGDAEIWNYAAEHEPVILTKHADFRQRSLLLGHPPKVIWIRLGNCSTNAIEQLLRERAAEIEEFLSDDQASILGLA